MNGAVTEHTDDAAPPGKASTSSAALYSTTGGQGGPMSERPIAQPLSQSVPIMRAVGGDIEHMAVDGNASLKDINPFGRAPTASAFVSDLQ